MAASTLSLQAKLLGDSLLSRNIKQLSPILADDAVLHQDSELDDTHVDGAAHIGQALAKQWSRHSVASAELLASAADDATNTSFHLFCFKEMTPKEAAEDGAPAWASIPRDVLAIWHAVFNADAKIIELVVLNTLPADSAYRKLRDAGGDTLQQPDASRHGALRFDPSVLARQASAGNDKTTDVAAAVAASNQFCDLFDHADQSAVTKTVTEDFLQWDAVKGTTMNGPQPLQKQLEKHGEYWQDESNWRHVAAVDGGAAFLHWVAIGHLKPFAPGAKPDTYYGLELSLTTPEGKVSKTLHLSVQEPKKKGAFRWVAGAAAACDKAAA